MSALPASREPGVSRTNGTPAVAGWANSSTNASVPMWPCADPLVPVLERAAHVHRVVGVHQAQPPGPADLDDPVDGRGRAAGLVERRAGGEDVAGVEADAGLAGGGRGRRGTAPGPRRRRTASGPGRRSARAAATGRRRRPTASSSGSSPSRTWRIAAAYRASLSAGSARGRRTSRCARRRPRRRSRPRGAGCGRPTATDARRSRGGRAEVHEVRRVDERPHAALADGRRGTRASSAGRPGRERPAAGVADEDLERLAAELASALRERAGDQPLADRDVGADRVAQVAVEGRSSMARR